MTVGTSFARGLCGLLPTGWRAAAAAGLLALAGCGGGDTVDEFSPNRLLVFGDESSLLTDGTSRYPALLKDGETPHPQAGQLIPAGRKYSINGLDPVPPPPEEGASAPEPVDTVPPGPIDCKARPLWVQDLAADYGFEFEECTDDPEGTPQRALMYAQADARVADIAAQIAVHEAGSSFTSRDLVTVFAGQHDVLDIYAGVTALSQCRYEVANPERSGEAARAARERGAVLAGQINRMARDGDGARVLFVTVPNQGATPYARQEPTDFNRRDCLRNLTDAFNAGLRFNVVQDGRQIGLVAIDEQVELILDDDRYDFDNVTQSACLATALLPDCTTDTLEPQAQGRDYLWADDLHFGPLLHEILGDRARSRVRNNPF